KSKLSIRNGISEIFRSNVVYEVPREREFPGPERIFGMPWAPEMNSTSGIMEKPKKDNQSNNTTVLSPQFTLNFNGTNMSPREMASVIVKHVRIAYDNLSSPSNRNAGFGGAHA
ncbi:MAG TPA: hypothetical protein VN580_05300, partial [Clostridia bacterium]|nr:hypothetical protein [Clostridia bacterium]